MERFNPFPGLRAFEAEEEHLFFGRETQVDELLARLQRTRFLTVVGSSGSGKSSLVRSGLIPSLYGGYMVQAGSTWRIATMRPGDGPIANLASSLAGPEILEGNGQPSDMRRGLIEATLRRGNRGLVEVVHQARLPVQENLLVVVDQFEELFRFKSSSVERSSDETAAFVKLLLEASRAEGVSIYVVLTMRSDFLGNCVELYGLPEAINEGQYLVPRMTRNQRRSAIAGPVGVGGAKVSPRLVTRLLNDVGDNPDQLPILQHVLMRTWDYWSRQSDSGNGDEVLDLRHYEAVGTIAEALSLHAEEAFEELGTERARLCAEKLFKSLTEKGDEGKGVRRPMSVREISAVSGYSMDEVVAVIERFRQPGRSFLMPPAGVELDADSTVDLSHESLMRVWQRLRRWVDDEAQSAQLYFTLARVAARHQEGRAGLWRDPELQLALRWKDETQPTVAWAQRYEPSFERAMVFLDLSHYERKRENERKERLQKRQLKRARLFAGVLGLAAFFILLAGLGSLALRQQAMSAAQVAQAERDEARRQRQRAETERERAVEAREEADQARDRAENAESKALGLQRKEAESRLLAQRNEGIAMHSAAEAIVEKERADLARGLAEIRRQEAVEARDDAQASRERAQRSEAETQKLRRLELARDLAIKVPGLVQADRLPLAALAALQAYTMHRDNGGGEVGPELYDALRGALLGLGVDIERVLDGHRDAVRVLAVAGHTLVSGGDDGVLYRLDLSARAAPLRRQEDLGTPVRSLAFDRGGRLLAAGGLDGQIRLWDLAAGAPLGTLTGHTAAVHSLSLSPTDEWLASGGTDGSVRLWRLDPPGLQAVLADDLPPGPGALVYNPDGTALAAGDDGGRVWLWRGDLASGDGQRSDLVVGSGGVRSLAFAPDGQYLAVGTADGSLYRLDLGGSLAAPMRLTGHRSSVNGLAWSPNGQLLASASSDRTVRLWSLGSSGLEAIVLTGHRQWVWSVAFSADGTQLYTGSSDRQVRSWSTRPGDLASLICPTVERNMSRVEWRELLPADLAYEAICPELPEA